MIPLRNRLPTDFVLSAVASQKPVCRPLVFVWSADRDEHWSNSGKETGGKGKILLID